MISTKTCFLRGTHAKKGRTQWLSPESGAVRELHYGRIIFDKETVRFENGSHETGMICLGGRAEVSTCGSSFSLGLYDSLYVPRDSTIEVSGEGCDLAEISAPVEHSYPLQFVPYASVKSDPGLHFQTWRGVVLRGRSIS